ncbi:MAG: DUF4230 domain-containing protein [Anaerolineaceae bacterium]|nr:DUF4230 domain-containing protein [Anaerolineaceae bacterium]
MTNGSESVLSVRGCLKVIGVLVLLTIIVMVAFYFLARSTADWVVEGVGQGLEDLGKTIAEIPASVAKAVRDLFRTEAQAIVDTKLKLERAIKPMGMLITASQMAEADVRAGIKNGFLNLCGVAVDYRADVTIEAGVDLTQVSASDVSHDNGTNAWILNLGAAQVHSCRIDYIMQHDHTFTLCRQGWDDYRLLAEYDALKEIRDQVLLDGLLPQAELVAEEVLANFVKAVTGSDEVRVSFESEEVPQPQDFPDSCLRDLPDGWKFDEESDSWVRE